MICDRCEDQGVIPVPGRQGMVTRCPTCHGKSWALKVANDYEQAQTKAILIGLGVGLVGMWFLFWVLS